MTGIFLDTVGLLALWDVSDQWHASAEAAFANFAGKKALLTTSFVLLECANAAARRPYRQTVEHLRQQMEVGQMLVFPTSEDWRKAWNTYEHGAIGQPGVVDCVSFAVMQRLGIRQAFTNDKHFRDAGFETLF